MESAAATVYAQGGKGNPRLLAWEGDKTATFTFEEALLSPLGFQVLSGAGVVDATKTIMHHTVRVQAREVELLETSTLSLTAEMLPVGAKIIHKNPNFPLAKIFVMELDANGELASRLPVDNGTGGGLTVDIPAGASTQMAKYGETRGTVMATIAGAELVPGNIYLVDLYVEVAGSELVVESGKFAGYYYIEANTLFRRLSDGMDVPTQFTVPKGKIQSNFTFTMASTGDPSTFTFTVDAFPDYLLGATYGKKVLFSLSVAEEAVVL